MTSTNGRRQWVASFYCPRATDLPLQSSPKLGYAFRNDLHWINVANVASTFSHPKSLPLSVSPALFLSLYLCFIDIHLQQHDLNSPALRLNVCVQSRFNPKHVDVTLEGRNPACNAFLFPFFCSFVHSRSLGSQLFGRFEGVPKGVKLASVRWRLTDCSTERCRIQ